MIQKNELRIGNYVDFNGELAKISQLWDKEAMFKCGDSDLYENLKAILLTEELLLKCGFKKRDRGIGWDKFIMGDIEITLAPTNKGKIPAYHIKGEYVFIQALHKLQNLYFALTNKELEVKLC